MRGVYKITNKINNKCYIGRSNNVFTQNFNEYGFDSFTLKK